HGHARPAGLEVQLEDAVTAYAEVRIADQLGPRGGDADGPPLPLDDQVVVADALPFGESHGSERIPIDCRRPHQDRAPRRPAIAGPASAAGPSPRSTSSAAGVLRSQVSWARASRLVRAARRSGSSSGASFPLRRASTSRTPMICAASRESPGGARAASIS